MKKCEICGKLYDDSYNKCPHNHLFAGLNKYTDQKPPGKDDAKKGCFSCLGCLGLIILVLIGIGIIGNKLPEKNKNEAAAETSKAVLDFGYIQFSEDDLPFLEKFKEQYFVNVELSEYNYSCFMDPEAWEANPYPGKETIFIRCAAYGAVKMKEIDKGTTNALVSTYIRSYKNGETIGSFGFKGYNFK